MDKWVQDWTRKRMDRIEKELVLQQALKKTMKSLIQRDKDEPVSRPQTKNLLISEMWLKEWEKKYIN